MNNPFGNPSAMALLGLSQGLLQAGGPSPMPVNMGGALGQGIQGALSNYMLGQKLKQQQELMALQRAEAERAATRPVIAPPGSHLFRQGETAPFYQVPFSNGTPEIKAPQTRKLRIGNEEVTQEFVGGQWKEVGRGPAFSDKPLVQIMPQRQDTKFTERVGTELGEQYAGLLRSDMNAPATIAKYQRLGGLLGQVNTGKFKGATTDIKASAKALGIDLTAVGVTDDVAPAQAARALSNQIALELRNPSGGAGMPGALSERDLKFLIESTPGLENDPASIPKMIEYRVKLAQREQQVAKMARAYRKKNGRFDESFYDELAEWSAKNPLFSESQEKPKPVPMPVGTLSPDEQSELEQLRQRFKK